MINLLLLEEKQKLASEKKQKLVTVWGVVILFSLVCLTLILLSLKFYVLAEYSYQKDILEQSQKQNQTPDFINFSEIIKKYNATLSQIDSFYKKELYLYKALEVISRIPSPAGLYVINISLIKDDSGKIQVSMSGLSNTRDDLLAFKKNIEDDKEIKKSYFPPENWVTQKNVNFSLTFEIDALNMSK
jgi:hypothetical protein